MGVTTISLTEAKRSLGEVVNRVAYGGERIILESRGKPKAAIISVGELARLDELTENREARKARRQEAFAQAVAISEQIAARGGSAATDVGSVAIVNGRRDTSRGSHVVRLRGHVGSARAHLVACFLRGGEIQ